MRPSKANKQRKRRINEELKSKVRTPKQIARKKRKKERKQRRKKNNKKKMKKKLLLESHMIFQKVIQHKNLQHTVDIGQ